VLVTKERVRGAKLGFRYARLTSWRDAEDYLYAKHDQAILFDEQARSQGLKGFIDDKSYRPGLGTYER
jgi:trans-feruloyl-CoA hydratase/vanillin synthase